MQSADVLFVGQPPSDHASISPDHGLRLHQSHRPEVGGDDDYSAASLGRLRPQASDLQPAYFSDSSRPTRTSDSAEGPRTDGYPDRLDDDCGLRSAVVRLESNHRQIRDLIDRMQQRQTQDAQGLREIMKSHRELKKLGLGFCDRDPRFLGGFAAAVRRLILLTKS